MEQLQKLRDKWILAAADALNRSEEFFQKETMDDHVTGTYLRAQAHTFVRCAADIAKLEDDPRTTGANA